MKALAEMGVDYAGLIFYPRSARYAGEKLAGAQREIKDFSIKKVGVFVNEEAEEIKRKIKHFGLAAVQLHGDESAEFCKDLMLHAAVIKVFRMGDQTDIETMLAPFRDACDYYLFDTDTNSYGGSGKQFNWAVLESVVIDKPFFLSGGIGPGDVEKIKRFQNPFMYAVDVNSRFETAPGVKDLGSVQAFINNLKA